MIEVRQTDEFARWLRKLRDMRAADRIIQRIRRLERGNAVVILLCGGDKRSQQADIKRAREMADRWKD